jgi:CheY-like chemotaxis protein
MTEPRQPISRQPLSRQPISRRALVVEADPVTLRLCRNVLESSGFVVDAVDSGIAAVVAARQGRPDLILMDLQLRDVPGGEAIGWLRSNPALRSTPIIVITANGVDDGEFAAALPAASLRKPLSSAALRRTLQDVLK